VNVAQEVRLLFMVGISTIRQRTGVIVVLSAFVTMGAAACGSSPQGYNNVSTLEQAIKSKMDSNLQYNGSPERVRSVTCVHQGGTQFQCSVVGSLGDTWQASLTVAASGSTWVTNHVSSSQP
jgi:hypothetical protein